MTISPAPKITIQNALNHSFFSRLDKTCHRCQLFGVHKLSIKPIELPTILIVLVNRFLVNTSTVNKNTAYISIEKTLNICQTTYELLSIVHHHGDYITSGHYTALAKYQKYFVCNDIIVKEFIYPGHILFKTAYIILYKKME